MYLYLFVSLAVRRRHPRLRSTQDSHVLTPELSGVKSVPGTALNPEGGCRSSQGRSSGSPHPHAFPSRGTVAQESAERNQGLQLRE